MEVLAGSAAQYLCTPSPQRRPFWTFRSSTVRTICSECDATLAVIGSAGIWALGDCAQIPMRRGEPCPPTTQHAIRQAKLVAANILATHAETRKRSFAFTGLGKLGALGHHRAVAELPGGVTVRA